MPRDGSGNYSLPTGYLAVTGETITANQHNPPLEDLASAMTDSLPRDGSAPMAGNLAMGTKKITNLAQGTASTDAITKAQLDAVQTAVNSVIPIGSRVGYCGTTAPTNWLFCNGQAVSRTTYSALFAVISTTYGAGDGSTTFNVPDYRGRVGAGKDDMGGTTAQNRVTSAKSGINGLALGATGGTQTHTLTSDEMPEHTHAGSADSAGAHTHQVKEGRYEGGGGTLASGDDYTNNIHAYSDTSSNGAHTHTLSINSAGSDAEHQNMQPTIIENVIIKAL